MSRDNGSTFLEILVALGLTMLVTTGAVALMSPVKGTLQAQPELIDMNQRMRAATDALSRDLALAGAGMDAGSGAGSLARSFAPVIPRTIGLAGADATTVARADAITITYVPRTYAQATTSGLYPQGAGLTINNAPNCPWGDLFCGFQAGMTVGLFDTSAHFDLFTISNIQAGSAQLQSHSPALEYTYPAGARVAQMESRSYYFDAVSNQLRQYDGYQTDVPVVDHVVGLSFEYFGDPNPPVLPRPPAGVENCLYDAAGQPKPMVALTSTTPGPVALPLAMLNDGPWCGSGSTQFDADLLRVRRVRVTLRMQAALSAVRASGADLAAAFTIVPRNLEPGR